MESMDKAVSELLLPDHPQSISITIMWVQKELNHVVSEGELLFQDHEKMNRLVGMLRSATGKLSKTEDEVAVLEVCQDILNSMQATLKQMRYAGSN